MGLVTEARHLCDGKATYYEKSEEEEPADELVEPIETTL